MAERWNPLAVIVCAWAVLVLPLVFLRGFNSDEGVAVTIARTAIEDGLWLEPHMFNIRLVERPTLLSWIVAIISLPFGSVNQFTARLPIVLSLLGGCLLIFWLLRRVASTAAALLGAALFLCCPLVIKGYVMTTADLPLAVLLFWAFYVWWTGFEAGRLSVRRWLGIGVILALAGLMKGPQPIGYFALGVGGFILLTRAWAQLPGLVLAGIVCVIPTAAWYAYVFTPGDEMMWAYFMRLSAFSAPLSGPLKAALELIVGTLPAALLAPAFLVTNRFRDSGRVTSAFVKALTCYAGLCTIVLLFWPGGSTPRYYFPMVPALCVLGGLAYDALVLRAPLLVGTIVAATLGILACGVGYSMVAAPLLPRQFRSSQIDGTRIAQIVRDAPATIYRIGPTGLNELVYVPGRIVNVSFRFLETIRGPAWIAVPADNAARLLAIRGDSLRVVISFGRDEEWRLLRLAN